MPCRQNKTPSSAHLPEEELQEGLQQEEMEEVVCMAKKGKKVGTT
jgi:hypothetical protein